MNKTLATAALAATALTVPLVGGAEAKRSPRSCAIHNVGYAAGGTLTTAATLTQTAGAATTDTKDDRYSGSLTVQILHNRFHAKPTKGKTATYTVSNIRLGKGVTATPAAGTRVRLYGKITKVNRKCPQPATGTGVVTIKRAVLHAAKTPATA